MNIAELEDVVLSQGASVAVRVTFTRGDGERVGSGSRAKRNAGYELRRVWELAAVLGSGLASNDGFLVAMAGLHSIRLAKFDFQGILDRNFGADGIATYAFGDSVETEGARMAIQSDGRIVVLTTAVGSTKDAVLLRFWN